MNGVRRLLNVATGSASPTEPQQLPPLQIDPSILSQANGPSWPPPSPSQQPSSFAASPKAISPLFIRKDRSSKPQGDGSQRMSNSTTSDSNSNNSPLSPSLVLSPGRTKSVNASIRNSNGMMGSPGASTRLLSASTGATAGTGPTRRESIPYSPEVPSNLNSRSNSLPLSPPSGPMTTRDELLISLLASEAVVDSRNCVILSSEELEELKKEHQVLQSRLDALNKKVGLETKIRDAALSLSKVNAQHKKMSKQTEEQIDSANRRLEAAQRDAWRLSERANEIYRKLMEHRAGVLSASVNSMEKKLSATNGYPLAASNPDDDSGYASNRSTLMSNSSATFSGSSSSKTRFDGAHLFAGHEGAIAPKRVLSAEAAASEITSLEDKLKAATNSLSQAGKKQAQLQRELSLLQLERDAMETEMSMELQSAAETIRTLEKDFPRLENLDLEVQELLEEKKGWEAEREGWRETERVARELRERLDEKEAQAAESVGAERLLEEARQRSQQELDRKEEEIQALRRQLQAKDEEVQHGRASLRGQQVDGDRARQEDRLAFESGISLLRSLMQQHGIVQPPGGASSSLQGMLETVGEHLEGYERKAKEWEVVKRNLENDVKVALDKRESLTREMDGVRKSRDIAEREAKMLKDQVERSPASSPYAYLNLSMPPDLTNSSPDAARIISILHPLFHQLPSPEARAAKFGAGATRSFRAGGGSTGAPPAAGRPAHGPGTASTPGTPTTAPMSLSDLDVRSLKTLYETARLSPGNGTNAHANGATSDVSSPSRPSSSSLASPGGLTPQHTGSSQHQQPQQPQQFSVELFAQRVQALIADDKALIERLVRFAQAHDLLKKNAERAQRLAQDSHSALETYQKQVKLLEDRNASLAGRVAVLQVEANQLQESLETLTMEKQSIEMQAAEQAETCRQLNEANNVLSAKTLLLAQEAAASAHSRSSTSSLGSPTVPSAQPQMKQLETKLMRLSSQNAVLERELGEVKKALERSRQEVDAMMNAEKNQSTLLMEELMDVQTENGKLRDQLRGLQQGRK